MTLESRTLEIKAARRKALVAFLTAGFPDEPSFLDLARASARAGCDVIEIGVPFSDPIADGPLIQASSKRALENGINLSRCLHLAATLAPEVGVPIVLMSYVNPILRLGIETFAVRARESGVAGLIIPDLPIEESEGVRPVLRANGLTPVDLVAPTSNDERIARIARGAEGFLYLVSVTGVTGVRSPLERDLEVFVSRVRARTLLPLYVGFGISSADGARSAIRHADGVIIGSALIRAIQTSPTPAEAVPRVEEFLREVRSAIGAHAAGADRVESSHGR